MKMFTSHPAAVFLSQYTDIKNQIESLESELSYLRDLSTRSTANWSGVKTSGNRNTNGFSDLSIRIVDKQSSVLRLIKNLHERLDIRLFWLEQMQNQTEKTLLLYRYINGLDWSDVARKLHYEDSRIYQLHREALEHFWELYQRGGTECK